MSLKLHPRDKYPFCSTAYAYGCDDAHRVFCVSMLTTINSDTKIERRHLRPYSLSFLLYFYSSNWDLSINDSILLLYTYRRYQSYSTILSLNCKYLSQTLLTISSFIFSSSLISTHLASTTSSGWRLSFTSSVS